MATTHKPFRELVKPGSNFEFMGRARLWVGISALLVIASLAMPFINKAWRGDYMNWSTDFKGGTEIIVGYHKAGTDEPAQVSSGDARKALKAAGFDSFEVSDYTWDEQTAKGVKRAHGTLVRTRDFGAVPQDVQDKVADDYAKQFPSTLKVSWSGDRIFIRSKQPVDWKAAQAFLAQHGLTLKPWDQEREVKGYTTPEEGTGEYNAQLAVAGIDAQYRAALAKGLGKGVDVRVIQVYGVGAKAGTKLRNDGIKSLFYAMLLIMLYLIFRFDIRYAPGAVIALMHDSILVFGVFALTWQEFSLTTVAAILTVIGYSVNDTVIIYDRIRENAARLKDKKFARVMNISINETLSRSLLTSLTVFVVTLMMNVFGTGLVRNFAFAMNIGVVVGTYSSIFVASPLALWIHNRYYGNRPAPARMRARRPRGEEAIEDEG